MGLIWGIFEVFWGTFEVLTGLDLLARSGDTCPHCGRVLEGSPPKHRAAKAPDDELAGSDPGRSASDTLLVGVCGVASGAMLLHMACHWYQSSARRADPAPFVATAWKLPPSPPVAGVPAPD